MSLDASVWCHSSQKSGVCSVTQAQCCVTWSTNQHSSSALHYQEQSSQSVSQSVCLTCKCCGSKRLTTITELCSLDTSVFHYPLCLLTTKHYSLVMFSFKRNSVRGRTNCLQKLLPRTEPQQDMHGDHVSRHVAAQATVTVTSRATLWTLPVLSLLPASSLPTPRSPQVERGPLHSWVPRTVLKLLPPSARAQQKLPA